MSIEILKSIRLTEEEAEELRKQSVTDGKKIITEASKSATSLVEKAVSESEAKAKEIIFQAEKEAEAERDGILDQIKEECSKLKENSRKNMDKAVDIIVGRIVKAHGYS